MKVASRPRFRKPKIDLQSQMFTLSKAKTYLGRLMEKAGRGEFNPRIARRGANSFRPRQFTQFADQTEKSQNDGRRQPAVKPLAKREK